MQLTDRLFGIPRLDVAIDAIEHPACLDVDRRGLGKMFRGVDALEEGVGRADGLEEVV